MSAIRPGGDADWFCADLRNQEQSAVWCVPASLSIVSRRVFGRSVAAADLAILWDQHENQLFDPRTMYAKFKALCVSHGMAARFDYDGTRHELSWAALRALGQPMLWAFDQHAEVCIGTCPITDCLGSPVRGYCVLNPASTRGSGWQRFPPSGTLGLDFAFTVPQAPCPGRTVS